MSSVDVIVPCYQYGHFLEHCVSTVLSQEQVEVRVLIIDDASQDNTREVGEALARKDSRVQYVSHVWNRGHIRTFNEGIAWSASRYLVLLSADDYLLPGSLSRATALMDSHPEVGFTFGTAIYRYPDASMKRVTPAAGRWFFGESKVFSGRRYIDMAKAGNMVATPTVVVRTDIQKKVGGYRTELPHAGDMEMWLRFASCSSVGFVRAPQAVYRRHERNMSCSYVADNLLPDVKQRRAALDCFFGAKMLPEEELNRLRTILYRDLAIEAVALASGALNSGNRHIARELAELAVKTAPNVRQSWAWMKYSFKRMVRHEVKTAREALQPSSEELSPTPEMMANVTVPPPRG